MIEKVPETVVYNYLRINSPKNPGVEFTVDLILDEDGKQIQMGWLNERHECIAGCALKIFDDLSILDAFMEAIRQAKLELATIAEINDTLKEKTLGKTPPEECA